MTVSTELPVATSAFCCRGVGQAPVAGAQEGVGTRVDERDAAQGAGQPRVALGAALADGLTGRLVDLRAELGPRHQMRGRGEPGHVDPDLGDQLGSGNGATPGMSASRAAGREKGPIASSIRASSAAIWALMRSLLSSIICRIVAW